MDVITIKMTQSTSRTAPW